MRAACRRGNGGRDARPEAVRNEITSTIPCCPDREAQHGLQMVRQHQRGEYLPGYRDKHEALRARCMAT